MTTVEDRPLTSVARTFPMAAADRPWAHAGTVGCVLGPLRRTDPDAVVRAVATLAAIGPQTRIGLVRHGERAWRYDPAALDPRRLVTAVGDVSEAAFRDLVAQVVASPQPTGDPSFPVHFVVADHWFALINHHLLGDGSRVMRIAAAVLGLAHGGEVPAWTADEPFARPLSTALWRTFGRQPRQVRALLAERPDLPAAPQVRKRPWTPSAVLVAGRTTTDARKALVRWGAEHAPGASLSALALAALRSGLVAQGIALDPTTSVAINARRYLPRGASVPGNFAARLDVLPVEPDSAASLHEAIELATAVGRPLAALAASALGSRRAHPAASVPTSAPVGVPAHLGYSWFGRPMEIERLPWEVPTEQRVISGHVDPGGAEQFGSLAFLIGGGLQYSVNFHDNRHDAAAVRRAVAAITADPVAVLEARRG